MPIKPENLLLYPKNWKAISKQVRAEANNKCEFCGIENYTIKDTGSKVVLTVAHLDHNPRNNKRSNLKALCQKCHLEYDRAHHLKMRLETLKRKKEELSKKIYKKQMSFLDSWPAYLFKGQQFK
jgi:5-methylcytosine-specific restriction endonuclease McrA